MLSYQQLETIAGILNWTVAEVEASLAELNAGFMVPFVEDMMAGDCEGEIVENGVYYRLSAPGYLDATDWHGPFLTEEDAAADMLSMYCD